jgi:pSer/pThr/pTyr-binding forkhead associated (FHA) protein
MVPATMRLLGNANWWMPAWLRRIVPELKEGPAPELAPQAGGVADGVVLDGAPASTLILGHLRAVSGSLGTDDIVLLRTRPLRVGRDESNDLQFFDDRISRFHARVDFDPVSDMHVVVDLSSTNGVYVNGQRIAVQPATTPLRQGDRVEFGGSGEVVLIYELRPLVRALQRPQMSVGV